MKKRSKKTSKPRQPAARTEAQKENEPTFQIEPLEPRILLSTTWVGTDGDDVYTQGNADGHLDGGAGNDILYGNNHQDVIYGGEGNDQLFGGNHDDFLDGGAGDDQLFGGNHNDTLVSGGGNDYMDGGAHNDTFLFDGAKAGDQITVVGGSGYDTIDLSNHAANNVILEGNKITVNVNEGSFTINHSEVENIITGPAPEVTDPVDQQPPVVDPVVSPPQGSSDSDSDDAGDSVPPPVSDEAPGDLVDDPAPQDDSSDPDSEVTDPVDPQPPVEDPVVSPPLGSSDSDSDDAGDSVPPPVSDEAPGDLVDDPAPQDDASDPDSEVTDPVDQQPPVEDPMVSPPQGSGDSDSSDVDDPGQNTPSDDVDQGSNPQVGWGPVPSQPVGSIGGGSLDVPDFSDDGSSEVDSMPPWNESDSAEAPAVPVGMEADGPDAAAPDMPGPMQQATDSAPPQISTGSGANATDGGQAAISNQPEWSNHARAALGELDWVGDEPLAVLSPDHHNEPPYAAVQAGQDFDAEGELDQGTRAFADVFVPTRSFDYEPPRPVPGGENFVSGSTAWDEVFQPIDAANGDGSASGLSASADGADRRRLGREWDPTAAGYLGLGGREEQQASTPLPDYTSVAGVPGSGFFAKLWAALRGATPTDFTVSAEDKARK